MTNILPFGAIVYNQDKIQDLKQLVCPPYDVISPSQQEAYLNSSPYNLIHILLGKDSPGEDKYARAGNLFRDWIKEKILMPDLTPAIYFYAQDYIIAGEKKTRLGFIALLELEDKNQAVFKHEYTRKEPKEDRLKLIRQVKANLSPIFAIISDHKRVIQMVYQRYIHNKKPFIDIADKDGVRHKLWRIDSPEALAIIEEKMRDENIFIADGHHRYEVACNYRQETQEEFNGLSGKEGCNYILTYFTNTDNRGLTIMPVNRLVKLDANFIFEKFKLALAEYFDVEAVKDKHKFFFLMQKAGANERIIGMYWQRNFWLLRLKNVKILDKIISDKQKDYRQLDVSVLNYIVLKRILGLDIEDTERIGFNHDREATVIEADKLSSTAAFFLNPVRIEQVMSIALSGERMPSKSTYFYPKVLSGLVMHKF